MTKSQTPNNHQTSITNHQTAKINRRLEYWLLVLGYYLVIGIWCLVIQGCGGGGLYTAAPPQESVTVGPVEVVRNAFLFGSDYPAEIVIPDLDGMRDTAFVVSTENPAGVVAIDLTTSPLQVSTHFKGMTVSPGHGYPRGPLVIAGATRAYCLTSSHLIVFNPTTGAIDAAIALAVPVTLTTPGALSRPYDVNGDGIPETTIQQLTPSFPGGLVLINNTLYVSFSNYLQATQPAAAAPGLVQAFTVSAQTPNLIRAGAPIVTSAYNPTALAATPDGLVLVVNSGVNDVIDAATIPQTDAGVDFIDPTTGTIVDTVNLGPVALAFQPPTFTTDGTLAFVASASYGEIYTIDLTSHIPVFDHTHPITITGNTAGKDYLSDLVFRHDGHFLFVGSFTQSALYAVDLRPILPRVLPPAFPDPIAVGFPAGVTPANPSGVNTGIGAIAARPGQPDIDYTGPDLFVLTGTPGTLLTINTRGSGGNPSIAEEPKEEVVEEKPEVTVEPPKKPPAEKPPAEKPPPEQPPPAAPPLVILSDPPPGTDAGADKATFTQGSGGGFGTKEKVLEYPVGGTFMAPNSSSVYSLGCGGSVILEMTDFWIVDGPGPDFIVFENAMGCPDGKNIAFPEPGAVGVSQDGTNFVEFPCTPPPKKDGLCAYTGNEFAGCAGIHPTLSSPTNGIDPSDPLKAGGDAFDLAQVKMKTARYVRVRDVSCTQGTAVTAGFDLDAVVVVNGTVPK